VKLAACKFYMFLEKGIFTGLYSLSIRLVSLSLTRDFTTCNNASRFSFALQVIEVSEFTEVCETLLEILNYCNICLCGLSFNVLLSEIY